MHTNSLINETSPYLLQHAHNPVNWFAWNDETLLKAQSENKMLLISIGYAACHWCHVMEHESFENEEVARVMNTHFICIKVDREERPDVDQVYMDAAYLVNGNGGWPLNALAMPDGKPFFAGTYYPKENWIRLLEYFAGIYQNERSKLEEQAAHLSKGIAEIENFPAMAAEENFHKESFEKMFLLFEKRIDKQKGGTMGAMKFPMPSVWEFLLQYHHFSGNKESLQAVETTLINMAKGGIYDQVGGGFSRYATDPQWHVPHFEKMLYDNAQLVSLYSHAFQVNKDPAFKRIVYETIAFVNRELLSPGGGYYSSLDADSEGEEGKFYVWSKDEIKEILKEDAELYIDYYGITSPGNWEAGKNIPDMNFGAPGPEEKYGESTEAILKKCIKANDLLLKAREKKVRPATDDKILSSWNAIMTKGFIDAYRAFGEISFLEFAGKTLDFLLKNIVNTNHSIYRNFKNDKATIPAFLDDYAFLIAALIEYYQVSFDESYLLKAQNIMTYSLENFYDTSTGTFYYTDKQFSKLIARKKEITDNVIPSSNSEMAANLLKLGILFDNADYQEKSARMVKNIFEETVKNVGYYSNWAITALQHIRPPFEIALVGNDWKSKLAELQENYLPHVVFMGGNREGKLPLLKNKMVEGKTMIYVCKNKNCQLPVEQAGNALEQLSS